MGAGALIFNTKGELLVVKPSYKDYWSIPGGTIDENESPRNACIREVKEEVGLDIEEAQFLCVDYIPKTEEKNENLQFTFYGGTLSAEKEKGIRLNKSEISEYRFVNIHEAETLFGGPARNLGKRFPLCLQALQNNAVLYLENGEFPK